MKKMGDRSESLQAKLDRFLFTYRVTPTNIGKSPSELLMNRQPRTRFNALRFTKTREQVRLFQENLDQKPKFKKGDAIFAKNFGKGPNWMPGHIIDIVSPKSYLVQVKDVVWKRHVDQMKLRHIPIGNSDIATLQGSNRDLDRIHEWKENVEVIQEKIVIRKPSKTVCIAEQRTDTPVNIEMNHEDDSGKKGVDNGSEINNRDKKDETRRTSGRERKTPKRLIEEKEV